MIKSMTGYAQKNITLEINKDHKIELNVSLKTVNSRFFEAQCRIPNIFSSWEVDLSRLLKKELLRGQAYCIITAESKQLKSELEVSQETIKDYVELADSISQKYKLDKLSVNTLLNLPNVFGYNDIKTGEQEKESFFKQINDLIDSLKKDRLREGLGIKIELSELANNMSRIVSKIAPASQEAHKEMLEKIEELQKETGTLPEEKLHMLAQLDKLDLNEEISRFSSHLEHFKKVLNSEQQTKGKELDFILQEMFREINTMASKTNSFTVSNLAVMGKVELEKAREQVQNIV